MQYINQVLATMNLPDNIKDVVEKIDFYQSISVLESYIEDKNSKSIQISIPTEVLGYITKNYQQMGNNYFNAYYAWKQVDMGSVKNIISEVRNTLLNLILKLEGKYGFEIKMEELIVRKKEVNNSIQNIMSQTIINKSDGNVINTGNNNTINNENKINKYDFQELRKKLESNQVKKSDIDELESIICEKPNVKNKVFGPKVNNWIKKMIGKSLDGTWSMGIGLAANALAELLKQYYGM